MENLLQSSEIRVKLDMNMKKVARKKVYHHHTNHVLWITLIVLALLAVGVLYNYQQMILSMPY